MCFLRCCQRLAERGNLVASPDGILGGNPPSDGLHVVQRLVVEGRHFPVDLPLHLVVVLLYFRTSVAKLLQLLGGCPELFLPPRNLVFRKLQFGLQLPDLRIQLFFLRLVACDLVFQQFYFRKNIQSVFLQIVQHGVQAFQPCLGLLDFPVDVMEQPTLLLDGLVVFRYPLL